MADLGPEYVGRKNGIWKILDKDYDDFFERI